MDLTTFIGLIGGLLTTIAFLPQLVKTWKTKSAKDLSLMTFVIQLTAAILWLVYGIFIKELPIILWNGVTGALVFMIIVFKLRYK